MKYPHESAALSANITLPPGSLQIWQTRLEVSPETLSRHTELLNHAERSRAARLVSARDRDRFIIARAMLRILLGRYLEIPPNSVQIEEGAHGKPFVAARELTFDLKFNLSHSQQLAVFAFARDKEVGIDVEKIRPDFASREIAERYFSAQEIANLEALAPERYTAAFFQCWTRKEAYIKARGQGLHIPLDSFSVSLGQAEYAPQLMASDSERWSMYSFEPLSEYVAAVVAEKSDWTLLFYEAEASALF